MSHDHTADDPDCWCEAAVCSAQYGKNPDLCYLPSGHRGTHSNRYGCTWPNDAKETR